MSPGIWLAPVFAPIGGVPLFLTFPNFPNLRLDEALFYIFFAIVIAYLFTALVVVPILSLTRQWVCWSAAKVAALGALSPPVVYLLWMLKGALAGEYPVLAAGHFEFVLMSEMPILIAISGAGLVVSVAYLLIHRYSEPADA